MQTSVAQIKKDTSLRKAILQAAITGQLISTCHSELDSESAETGNELLDKIIEERNKKLLAEWEEAKKTNPKAKKPAPVIASEIDEDEIPFEIPDNWCWCRLGELGDFIRGSGIKRDETKTEGFPCIRYGEMYTKYKTVINETISFVDKNVFDSCQKIIKNDIVMALTGENEYDIALAAVYQGTKEVAMGGDMTRLRPCYVNPLYLVYVLNSPYGIQCKSQLATGNIIVHISNDKLSSIILPLPPLAVQNAIVTKLEQVLPLVDAYENAILQKEELKSALPDKVKKAILQEAITGQLTEDWRKSATIKESGKQLLDRIIEERNAKLLAEWEEALKKNPKAKKPVPVVASEIDEEDIPFEVPESWCWCRLGDIGDFVRGSGIKRDETRPDGYPCIRYGEMYTKYKTVINETVSFVDKDVFDSCQKIIKNDIAMALTGENEYDIALAAVYTGDKEVAMGGDMTRLRPTFVNPLYLVFTLNSPYGIQCKSELATGNIIVHISNDKLGSILIPLPPQEEQAEIVRKVEELLPLCK